MKTLKYASLVSLLLLGIGSVAYANHSWGGYHWARTSNPFTLKLGSNLGSQWTPILDTTSIDWSKSDVLNTTILAGGALRYKSPQRDCGPTYGQVEVATKLMAITAGLVLPRFGRAVVISFRVLPK